MELSEIQVKILTKFITSEGLRYSEAKPEDVDNDLYKYHLKFLVTKGYIEKIGESYKLTEQGKLFGHKVNPYGQLQSEFRIAVICILIIREDGKQKILLQTRLKHPSYGEMGTVSGKIKQGEKIIDCAKRKFKEETGLDADFKYIGLLRAIRYNKDSKLINDQWFNVCLADSYSGELIEDNKYWKNYFVDLDQILAEKNNNIAMQNLQEIIHRIQKDEIPFMIENEAVLEEI
jgi:ADP-ribose pyrophosphatase YjhB (NUDIX family)